MSFIEGIGDEVTVFIFFMLILILATAITYVVQRTEVPSVATSPHVSARPVSQNPESNNERLQSNNNNETPEDNASLSVNDPVETDSHVEEVCGQVNSNSDETQLKSNEEGSAAFQFYPDIDASIPPSAPAAEEEESSNETTSDEAHLGPGEIRVRLKYLDDSERTVVSHPIVKIGDFKTVHFADDLANNKVVRLIFSGQLLQDNMTLQSYGVTDSCVIHVQILQAQTQQNAAPVNQSTELDLSHLLWPLLTVILGICWILYFKYPNFFNVVSLGMLFMFTGSFAYFYSQVQHQ